MAIQSETTIRQRSGKRDKEHNYKAIWETLEQPYESRCEHFAEKGQRTTEKRNSHMANQEQHSPVNDHHQQSNMFICSWLVQ